MVGFLASLFGGGIAAPVEAIGNVLDNLITSDEERAAAELLKAKLAQQPSIAQIELNKVEAAHRSPFVAGWRPGIGWVCALGLFFYYVPQYAIASYLWVVQSLDGGNIVPYPSTAEGLTELVLALLGLGALRTAEKFSGRAK